MDKNKVLQVVVVSMIILTIVLLDQYSKFAVKNFFQLLNFSSFKDILRNSQLNFNEFKSFNELAGLHKEIHEFRILPIFNLVYTYNYGISFGILNNVLQNQYLLIILSSIVIIVLSVILWEKYKVYLSCIIGGAIGNIIDRIHTGAVFDFIDLHWNNYHFPAFNVADSAIVIGIILVMLHEILRTKVSENSREKILAK